MMHNDRFKLNKHNKFWYHRINKVTFLYITFLFIIVITKMITSLSVPFDEDDKDRNVWFLDHDYLENMYGMFKKVNGNF